MSHFPERGVAWLLAGILLLGGTPGRVRADQRQIIPSLEVRTSYDSNVFKNETFVLGDFETTFAPGVEFREAGDWGRVRLQYRLNQEIFQRFTGLNSMTQEFSADGSRRLSPRLSLNGNANFILLDNVSSFQATNDLTIGDTASSRNGGGSLGFRYQLSRRTTLGLSANGALIRNDDKTRFDTTSAGAQLSLQHIVSRLSSINLQLGYSKSRFENQNSSNVLVCVPLPPGFAVPADPACLGPTPSFRVRDQLSRATRIDNQTLSLGASWTRQWTPAWQSTINLGVSNLSTSQSTSSSGMVIGSSQTTTKPPAAMTFTGGFRLTRQDRLGRFDLSFNRQTRPSTGEGATLDVNTFSLRYSRTLSRRLSFTLTGNLQKSLSSFAGTAGVTGSNIDTQFTSLAGQLSWRFSEQLQAFLSVTRRDQTATGTRFSQSFNDIVTTLGFRYNFPIDLP